MVNPADAVQAGAGFLGTILNSVSAKRNFDEMKRRAELGDKSAQESLNQLEQQQVLSQDDLFRQLKIGSGENDLREFLAGDPLSLQKITGEAYNPIENNAQINDNSSQNIEAYRELADTGFRDIDRAELSRALNQQRDETNSIQDGLTRNAIERGQNPNTANLTQRLLATQGGANRGSDQALNVASQGAQRRIQGLSGSRSAIGEEYLRKMELANARAGIEGRNVGIGNEATTTNFNRRNQIDDQNKGLHNALVTNNEDRRVQGNIGANESYNQKLKSLSTAYDRQADRQHRLSTERGQAGSNALEGAAKSGGATATALTKIGTDLYNNHTANKEKNKNKRFTYGGENIYGGYGR